MKNRRLFLALLCCVLASCSFNKIPAGDMYTISPGGEQGSSSTAARIKNQPIIKLAPMRASRAFSGTDIVYSTTRYEQNSYAYSRWSDAPVKLLPLLLQTALEATGGFGAVINSPSKATADFLLESTLYDFSHHVHNESTSDGVIDIRFHLIDTATNLVIATRAFHSQVSASSVNARDAAAALNKAAENVAHALAVWLVSMQL